MSYTMADGSDETVQVGSCETAPVCTDVSVSNVGFYASEISFTITDCDGNVLASGAAGYSDCLELPENYAINMSDSWGDGWAEDAITVGDMSYTMADGSSETVTVGDCGGVEPPACEGTEVSLSNLGCMQMR